MYFGVIDVICHPLSCLAVKFLCQIVGSVTHRSGYVIQQNVIGQMAMHIGTMGSLTGLSSKLGNALGGFLMGVLMSASGYVGGADVQVDSAIMMIRVLASVAPMALMLVVAVILRFYTVDKQMPQIKQDLEARAAATTEAAAE